MFSDENTPPTKRERLLKIEAEAAAIRAELEAEKTPKPLTFEDLEIGEGFTFLNRYTTPMRPIEGRRVKVGSGHYVALNDGRIPGETELGYYPLNHLGRFPNSPVVRQNKNGNIV